MLRKATGVTPPSRGRFFELAALVRDIFGPACAPGGPAYDHVEELRSRLQQWMLVGFPCLFGAALRPKLHKLIAHVLKEFQLRGNVKDCDAWINEAVHKAIKRAWLRTNRREEDYALKLIMAEQVASFVSCSLDSNASRRHAREVDEQAYDCAARAAEEMQEVDGETDAAAVRASGRGLSVGDLAAELGIPDLPAVLRTSSNEMVTLQQASYIIGAPFRHDGRRPLVRAAPEFYGELHYSWFF